MILLSLICLNLDDFHYNSDAAPLPEGCWQNITLGLVITKDCETGTPNIGVYRLQKQSKTTMTVHWLSVRGWARHPQKAAENGKKLEVAIAKGILKGEFTPGETIQVDEHRPPTTFLCD